ncbi:hypothetical protein BS17DRAFT_780025 [Gyrodon lividus]|nr:hypothetical protein BS17DRAFT_780025 [Gyrodon lividus]
MTMRRTHERHTQSTIAVPFHLTRNGTTVPVHQLSLSLKMPLAISIVVSDPLLVFGKSSKKSALVNPFSIHVLEMPTSPCKSSPLPSQGSRFCQATAQAAMSSPDHSRAIRT